MDSRGLLYLPPRNYMESPSLGAIIQYIIIYNDYIIGFWGV